MHSKMRKISAGNGENSSSLTSLLVLDNSDLLIKILLCLPVKYLLVFKIVSKHWYSLITDSYFMQKHCLLYNNKLLMSGLYFFCDRPNDQQIPTYGMLLLDKRKISIANVISPTGEGLHIQQSCNGILLCSLTSGYYNGTRYIYNPSTRCYRMIPPPPFDMNLSFPCYWKLAFSPYKSLYYEIVFIRRIGYVKAHYNHQMAVYSSEKGSWRRCGYVELDPKLLECSCVSWNGCLNWIDGPTFYYLDIAQQVLKTSQHSDALTQKYHSEVKYFEECVGHMYLILDEKKPMSNNVGVFEMEIDYSGWKPICLVYLGGLEKQYGNGYRILKVAHVQGDGDDEDELQVLILLPGKIVSYDIEKNSFEEICDYPRGQFVQHAAPAAYIGSLANV